MIFTAFLRAVGQLGDRRFRRVIVIGLLLALALLFGAYAILLMAIGSFAPDMAELPVIGRVTGLHQLFGLASLVFMLVLSVFLMVPVAGVFSSLFLEDIAAAVEARHYSWLPPPVPVARGAALVETLNLLGLIVALNLGGLALLPLVGPFYFPLFWALNGLLLGREYFALVAMRRISRGEMQAMRRRNRLTIWAAGVLMAAPLTLPLVNLVVPVLGVATFTHLFHGLSAADR